MHQMDSSRNPNATSRSRSRRRQAGAIWTAIANWLADFRGENGKKVLRKRLLYAAGGLISLGVLYTLFIWLTLPDIGNPLNFIAAESTVITDRNGQELYRLYQEEDRTFVDDELIPEAARQAVVAIEDERFYSRGCLDIRALLRAATGFGRSGGASTLTRQLARNALDLKQQNIFNRKIKELILGCQMESRYSKDELLNLYLNWIPFGQNAYGIEQASRVYFGKSASGLTLAESAVLAALPQRPSYFSPYGLHQRTTVSPEIHDRISAGLIERVADISEADIIVGLLGNVVGTGANTLYIGGRTDQVLQNMEDQGFITEQQRQSALDELITVTFQPFRGDIRAPHFVLWVREQVDALLGGEENLLENGGLIVETTLDLELQEAAESAVDRYKEDVAIYGAYNIALVALDPSQREILAYIGNADYNDEEHNGRVDMARAPRQPGSSFKPIVYAAAFENGYGPATVIHDVKTKIGDDEPQNFDGGFWGALTIRQALGASRNIPAAKAFFLAGGEEKVLQMASSLGAKTPLTRRAELAQERAGGFEYGWPLALGAAETPLLEMVTAYSTLADGGRYREPIAIRRITDKNGNLLYEADLEAQGTEVLDPRIAYQITSILSDESVRPGEYWRSILTVPGYQAAAKTGTSNKCLEWVNENQCKLRKPDNLWTLGYTPSLAAGVWVGNADSSALFDRAESLTSASPIWKDFMIAAHKVLPSGPASFTVPEGLVQPQISTLSGLLPAECTPVTHRKADIFLRENAPATTDDACVKLTVDKVTGLLASDSCPEDAQEEGDFYIARSVMADRWPQWQTAVDAWAQEQQAKWDANETHSGSQLPLPLAPTKECDPSLTPGRLETPELSIISPTVGGNASFPAFTPRIRYEAGSTIREVRYMLDGKRVAVETEIPFASPIRVPATIKMEGSHTLEVILTDEYYNTATAQVTFKFNEDQEAPSVRLRSPSDGDSFSTSQSLVIRAEADDPDGALKYVQFYLDDTLLTTKPAEPFELRYPLADLEPGRYTIRVLAEDLAKQQSEDSVDIIITE